MNYNEPPDATSQQPPPLDPYAPPSAHVAAPLYDTGYEAPLAERGSRFVAQLLNGLVTLPGGILIGMGIAFAEESSLQHFGIIGSIAGAIYLIGLLVINLRLLSSQGQSLGKKWARVRVVRLDGTPASLGRLIGLRYIVTTLLGMMPFVGGIFSLADLLFIFRGDRRCIHDLIADTKVVVA